MGYHYGITIKKYRIAMKMTLEQLASKWPSKEIGVNIRYVIDVEAGRKRITDVETLRGLASFLNIPLWEFGLSEYNPFHPTDLPGKGRYLYDETLLDRPGASAACLSRIVQFVDDSMGKALNNMRHQPKPQIRFYEF